MIDKIILLNPQDKTILKEEEIGAKSNNVSYNNSASGLEATTVKGAIDELSEAVDELWESIPDVSGLVTTQELEDGLGEKLSADDLKASPFYVSSSKKAAKITDTTNIFGTMCEIANTCHISSQLTDQLTLCSGGYGHEPNMVKVGNTFYIAMTFVQGYSGEGYWNVSADYPKIKVIFTSVTVSGDTMTKGQELDCFKNGDEVLDKDGASKGYIYYASAPNIAIIDSNTLRIITSGNVVPNAESSAGSVGYVFYRDYNIQTGTFGDVHICYMIKDGTTYEFSKPNFVANIESGNNVGFGVHNQYAIHKSGGARTFYINIGGAPGKNGNIFKSTDFIEFTYWTRPVIESIGDLGFEYEMALCSGYCNQAEKHEGNQILYFALRRASRDSMIVGRINFNTGVVVDHIVIPDGGSRPFFFSTFTQGDTLPNTPYSLYLMHLTDKADSRISSNIEYFSHNGLDDAKVYRVCRCSIRNYPNIIYNNGYFYVVAQKSYNDHNNVTISKFTIPFDWSKSVAAFMKMINTFEP